MNDFYKNFKELSLQEKRGVDFRIEVNDRKNQFAVIAIHGGGIEPMTSDIAEAISGEDLSFYSFIGMKSTEEENEKLHITSSHFDEPQCLELVGKANSVISVHGKGGEDSFVMVGGLDSSLSGKISAALGSIGFDVRTATEDVNGSSPQNICNRGLYRSGVQLEISRGLREELQKNPEQLESFCYVVRKACM